MKTTLKKHKLFFYNSYMSRSLKYYTVHKEIGIVEITSISNYKIGSDIISENTTTVLNITRLEEILNQLL